MKSRLEVQLLTIGAKAPQRAHDTDSGFDIFTDRFYQIQPDEIKQIRTGIAVHPVSDEPGFNIDWTLGCFVWDKSGRALSGLKTMGGVIDQEYRGELLIIVKNVSDLWIEINAREKIANLIVQRVELPQIVIVELLSDTIRGSGGFGSTGLVAQ